ncbi:putative s-adenosyl-l-methionine-dependent methyltransferase mida, partial [Globisporangium splendens]
MQMMRGGRASAAVRTALQRHSVTRALSTGADEAAVLTREYIYGALYAKDSGYFTTQDREVLHAPPESIDFTNLWGAFDYRREVASLYKEKKEAWLTPVEVFAPYYSHAIAKYMLNSPFFHKHMTIYEIGGGAGTNALHILNYLKDNAPDVYLKTKYTLIEISPVMAERQRQRVMTAHPQQCTVLNTDILTFADEHEPVHEQCFFLAMEVLDNLPHDKVTLQNGKWYESIVRMRMLAGDANDAKAQSKLELVEDLRPVDDLLIRQTMRLFGCELPLTVQYKLNNSFARKVRNLVGKHEKELHSAFIPTGAMQLLNTLRASFPRHHMIAADFDSLPAPNLDPKSPIKALHHPLSMTATSTGTLCAANAPLVASKTSGMTEDHDTYLVEGGVADIFFATDFAKLKKAYCTTLTRKPDEVSVVKSGAFLKEFADLNRTKTITGYNPLLEDYSNTSFLLS